ncbi:hypothetical protein DFH05DRAFT_513554 [Lentinula detonsa]|uniref:AB hydrolase-1 domain-containing protein n=1 Tax=Lentinula detonsa TaxID=2804962 RepID=A0A9W8NRS3_9AGAR|nr:hypothetical protein DFH05DRAFT_513554 [Lentinula detonsa]
MVHLVCPSLPGDIYTLLHHLHPEPTNLKLHICAHSFGCVAAQILYGAPYLLFPYGRCIAGLILLNPLSPPHCHKDYWKFLSWQSALFISTFLREEFFPNRVCLSMSYPATIGAATRIVRQSIKIHILDLDGSKIQTKN